VVDAISLSVFIYAAIVFAHTAKQPSRQFPCLETPEGSFLLPRPRLGLKETACCGSLQPSLLCDVCRWC